MVKLLYIFLINEQTFVAEKVMIISNKKTLSAKNISSFTAILILMTETKTKIIIISNRGMRRKPK